MAIAGKLMLFGSTLLSVCAQAQDTQKDLSVISIKEGSTTYTAFSMDLYRAYQQYAPRNDNLSYFQIELNPQTGECVPAVYRAENETILQRDMRPYMDAVLNGQTVLKRALTREECQRENITDYEAALKLAQKEPGCEKKLAL